MRYCYYIFWEVLYLITVDVLTLFLVYLFIAIKKTKKEYPHLKSFKFYFKRNSNGLDFLLLLLLLL